MSSYAQQAAEHAAEAARHAAEAARHAALAADCAAKAAGAGPAMEQAPQAPWQTGPWAGPPQMHPWQAMTCTW